MGGLEVADMAEEDTVILSGHRRLTFQEADASEGTEEGTIMVQAVVGRAGVVIRVVGRMPRRGRCSCDGMVVFAVVVDEL